MDYLIISLCLIPFAAIISAYYNEMYTRKNDKNYQKAIEHLTTNPTFVKITDGKKFYFVGHGTKNLLYEEPTKINYTILGIANIYNKKIGLYIDITVEKGTDNLWEVTKMSVSPPLSSFESEN